LLYQLLKLEWSDGVQISPAKGGREREENPMLGVTGREGQGVHVQDIDSDHTKYVHN
jgi:hypothetical protein